MQSINLSRRLLAAPAVLALAVSIGACSDGDDGDQARTESNPVDDGSSVSEENGTSAAAPESSGDVPQDSNLDIDTRHQNGTVLRLKHIAFQDDSIVIGLEAYNGANRTVQLHDNRSDARSLRLVDDAGNTYSFRPPDDMEDPDQILLEQSETLSGTWEFLGPLVGHPARLYLVTMLDDSEIEDVEPGRELGDDRDDDTMTSGCTETQYICSSFALPIDLTWD